MQLQSWCETALPHHGFNSPRVLLQLNIIRSVGSSTRNSVSILPESYCNIDFAAIMRSSFFVSILPESYCNRQPPEAHQVQQRFQFSQSLIATPFMGVQRNKNISRFNSPRVLLQQICVGKRDKSGNSFNSPRVLLQPVIFTVSLCIT